MKKFTEPTFSEKMKLEEEFFNKDFMMSFSGLSKLLYSPDLFYRHYILNQRDDQRTVNMLEGSLLHCLLLNPEEFDNEFVIATDSVPSDSIKQVLNHCLELYKIDMDESPESARMVLNEYSNDILEALESINLYQSLKNDEGRLKKVLTEKNEEYWEHLIAAEGKDVISPDMYDHIKEAVEKIKTNPTVMEKMGFFADSMNGITTENELTLVTDKGSGSFGIRGIIDNLVFDPEKKEIRINDLKTTSKSIGVFRDSIEFWNYWLQAAIYYNLVKAIYMCDSKYDGWTITFRFVVVDSYCQTGCIKISDDTMNEWVSRTETVLAKANYHFKVKDFKLPYEFLINDNELTL